MRPDLPPHYALAREPHERTYLLRQAERDDARQKAAYYTRCADGGAAAGYPPMSVEHLRRVAATYTAQADAAQLVMTAIEARSKDAA